jgi:phenylpyruvate tautomerase PptA (4-oxalocrotonate tautomerase family)
LKRGATVPLVRISLLKGRTADERRAIGDAVHQAIVETIGVPAQDVWINLVETARENWSFGEGLASYVPEEP